MKRLLAFGVAVLVCISLGPAAAIAQQSTFTPRVVACGTQLPGDPSYYAELTATISPVPSVDYDISAVSTVRGDFFHISLPAGFDITGATLITPLPLGSVVFTVFQDLNNNNVQDAGEPTIASGTLDRVCEPQGTEECKDGGWRSFPWLAFKNQGDCVSFVATGGKNTPASSP
jgi:hypothetical protein